MTRVLPQEGSDSAAAKVALVGSPHHTLGVAVCRHLAAQGVRLVITDPKPERGAAVCRRLAWQGVSASYRYFSPESSDCEQRLYEDLSLVFGRVDWLISFFDPARYAPSWLSFTDDQVHELLMPKIQFRRRLLKALDPLFTEDAMHLQVCMGVDGASDAASALLWDRLLSSHYEASAIRTRMMTVEGEVEGIDRPAAFPRSIELDLDRLITLLED
ncbi:MAG: hypothetical protein AAGB27_11440 [Pseudomonadota bacterium]